MGKYVLDTKKPENTDWQIKVIILFFYLAGIVVGVMSERHLW